MCPRGKLRFRNDPPNHFSSLSIFTGFDRTEETSTKAQSQYEDETEEVEAETEEPVEELPPSVKLGVGYRKPHYKVLLVFST